MHPSVRLARRLAVFGPAPFRVWTVDEAARAIWVGWEQVLKSRASALGERTVVLAFRQPGRWAGFGVAVPEGGWAAMSAQDRYEVFERLITDDEILFAETLPDLIEAMGHAAKDNPFSVWVAACDALVAMDGPERAATQTLLGLGGCGPYPRLLARQADAVADLREMLAEKQQAQSEAAAGASAGV